MRCGRTAARRRSTPAGAVDWWPAPRFDSTSAFSALLDDDAGRPSAPFEATWRHRPGTNVLETTMRTAGGTLRVTDALGGGARRDPRRGAANDLGLLAEEVDPATGEPFGNVPQAISQIGLVNAAQALTEMRAA